jgi:hypothetical protein
VTVYGFKRIKISLTVFEKKLQLCNTSQISSSVCIYFLKSSEEFLFKLTKRNLLFLFLNLFSVFMKNFAQAYLVNLRNSRLLCSNSDSISFFEFGSATSWTSLFTIVSRIVAFILDCANLFLGLPSEFDSCSDTFLPCFTTYLFNSPRFHRTKSCMLTV